MGCGSSRVTVVKPAEPRSLYGENHEKGPLEASAQRICSREDSAVSKRTTDSGLGPESGDATAPLSGAGSAKFLPLRGPAPIFAQQEVERQDSHEILEQLLSQGIIPAPPILGETGKAYSVMVPHPLHVGDTGKPLRRPPARLESLKTRSGQQITKEDIETRMMRAEERRKAQEEMLKQKLRAKSARFCDATRPKEQEQQEEEKENSLDRRNMPASSEPRDDRSLTLTSQSTEQHRHKGSYKGEGEETENFIAYVESDGTFKQVWSVQKHDDDDNDDFFQS
ncbi:stathmin domain-containing protein 1 [Scleropages formosus]|uniref:stathmin domain-containing protein 1 n=1 Tax=Scleropages formosus TaxID=113540 RepID=UPI000878E8D1|nr:stathmin domain-containing protein 1 [Scleropages formosus]